jgi:hypothetical protein
MADTKVYIIPCTSKVRTFYLSNSRSSRVVQAKCAVPATSIIIKELSNSSNRCSRALFGGQCELGGDRSTLSVPNKRYDLTLAGTIAQCNRCNINLHSPDARPSCATCSHLCHKRGIKRRFNFSNPDSFNRISHFKEVFVFRSRG